MNTLFFLSKNIAQEDNLCVPQVSFGPNKEIEHRMKPLSNMIKINIDATMVNNKGNFGFFMVIRGSVGSFVEARVHYLESVMRAKLVEALG
uniref:Uncharacterized protein n=1 Tax=Cannabis sativa TaxID=3483 RepID=A0A803PAR4_CANSA